MYGVKETITLSDIGFLFLFVVVPTLYTVGNLT